MNALLTYSLDNVSQLYQTCTVIYRRFLGQHTMESDHKKILQQQLMQSLQFLSLLCPLDLEDKVLKTVKINSNLQLTISVQF